MGRRASRSELGIGWWANPPAGCAGGLDRGTTAFRRSIVGQRACASGVSGRRVSTGRVRGADAPLRRPRRGALAPRPGPLEVRPKPHPKGSYSETITTSSPSISSAGTAPKVPSPAWKTTIETMSVAARGRRMPSTPRREHLCGTSVWLLSWRRGTIPRATGPRRLEAWLTSPGAFGSPESTRRHGLACSPTPRGLISKTGFGARKGMASGGWCPDVRSLLSR